MRRNGSGSWTIKYKNYNIHILAPPQPLHAPAPARREQLRELAWLCLLPPR